MEIESVRIGSIPHAHVEVSDGCLPAYSAVIVPVDTHMVVSSSLAVDDDAYLVGIYLVLAAAEISGLPPGTRARLFAEAELLTREGQRPVDNKKNGRSQSDRPL